ncbi:MAG: penicillin-binding protein 2, partial [Rhodospirillaceae bacterium]|nr:penicillin-binding protein 2 [Rhodospirillaceae bacterium]
MTGSKYATLGHMASHTIRIDGVQARILEVARNRLLVAGIIFLLAFLVVGGRLVALAAFDGLAERTVAKRVTWSPGRGDVFDRNGVLLATSLPVASLIANPREILDPVETTNRLVRMFPELDRKTILRRLSADTLFAQIRRGLTPGQQQAVLNLGLPGLQFNIEPHRVYPLGRMASHLLGFTNRNADGVAGAESAFNKKLAAGQSVHLSVDIGVQGVVRQELLATMREFRAIGAAGIVLDARNGEVLAMVSLPDYDPNDPAAGDEEFRFNRVTQGVYEMGSTFKLFTAAMALETGTVTLRSGYDASHPIRKAGYTIRDFHAQKRWLSVPEIIVHSSNIGAAQMALDVGAALQRNYLTQFGLMTPSPIELPEVGKPQTPKQWRDISTMTIGFGHGISVSPLQLASGVATIVNGGMRLQPTVLRRDSEPVDGKRVLSERTSELMRAIMRM